MTDANSKFRIAVLPGDGIGQEVMAPCLEVIDAALQRAGAGSLDYEHLEMGAATYQKTGEALPPQSLEACRKADAILLGAMGLPHIRYPDGTEIAPQLDLRFEFDLYAGVRPIRAIPGVPHTLASERAGDIDFVLIRESTEGLFASHRRGIIENDATARDTMVITRPTCERLFDFAFRLGERRSKRGSAGKVTCIDKANIFKSFAFFRKIFDERATAFPDIEADHAYVDAAALSLVIRPWDFDVMVTENMFGDILSDLGAGLIGGMGFAPSADIGDHHGVFQPVHGSAPDIAGQGKANPTAMFLSAAMMLDWLGERHERPATVEAGRLIGHAVDGAFAGGRLRTAEFGGDAGTEGVARAVLDALQNVPAGAGAE
jgi:3-isopropylmalate dehydrogenase